MAIAHSARESFGRVELFALAAAIGVSIWCMAKPLGAPKMEIGEPGEIPFIKRGNEFRVEPDASVGARGQAEGSAGGIRLFGSQR
ncbi:hypothetical protein [Mycobacterium szulgai]|uniref:Uncharacterized protein n=1 Tax=Mycobacterium szulgai TaxID=1787 RepID=A0A1X2EHW0_MYCSZ|nr:hypothetical protein [Mycobacterium szulgai]MCV7077014.1 hypothetical protein [Mycobacterium szulgai]ORX02702.1 hypothetical protein AWC27_28495 [Mycobacterium szulgai]